MLSVAEIYRGYEQEKNKRLLLDFDDLIIEVHKLLIAYDEIRYKYQQVFPHILVDEYQDTNPAQWLPTMYKPTTGITFFRLILD